MKTKAWKKMIIGVIAIGLIPMASSGNQEKIEALKTSIKKSIDANTGASDKVKRFMKDVLLPYCSNPELVAEIKKQNAKKIPFSEIEKYDKQWIDAEDEIPIMTEMMSNACAKEIKKIVSAHKALGETFVMDNQGANVGQNDVTSDYWQGDEPKWADTFKKGGVWVGKDKLDKSTYTKLQHVSLPIFTENGDIIGAICFGIKTGSL